MSSTLGPIHYLMYEKIKFQDRLTATLLDQDELAALNAVLPPVPTAALDEIIDQANIHGFLSAQIEEVEGRLAFAIAHGSDNLARAFACGAACAPTAHFNGSDELFQQINGIILDGMPCDMALTGSLTPEGDLLLATNIDTHSKFAADPLLVDLASARQVTCEGNHDHDDHRNFHLQQGKVSGCTEDGDATAADPHNFYDVRTALLNGFLSHSHYRAIRQGKNILIKAADAAK